MHRIAHLSDVHILGPDSKPASARYRFATGFVSLFRAIDPGARTAKLRRALAAAKAAGADHVVLSGDLTEVGDAAEFALFADELHASAFAPDAITLVPGNHDAYTSPTAWKEALAGPLAAFAGSSAAPGAAVATVVDRGNVAFLPIDVTRWQSLARSGGEFTEEAAKAVERRLADSGLRDKAVVLVLHHPPFVEHKTSVMQWIDGLRGWARVADLLARHPRLAVLHGHLHRIVDRIAASMHPPSHTARAAPPGAPRGPARIFGASATCDDRERARVRLYDIRGGLLESGGLFAM